MSKNTETTHGDDTTTTTTSTVTTTTSTATTAINSFAQLFPSSSIGNVEESSGNVDILVIKKLLTQFTNSLNDQTLRSSKASMCNYIYNHTTPKTGSNMN